MPPTNLMPTLPAKTNDMEPNQLGGFFLGLLDLARKSGVNVNDPQATMTFLKDVLPGDRGSSGWLYQNGPFTLVDGELVSGVISGGSELLNWIPSQLVDYRFENVKHLEYIAPEGFDGSQSYRDWLRSLTKDECDFGPSAVWSGFEYTMSGADWSFTSPVLKTEDFGLRDYAESPIYVQRGDQLGRVLNNDADWATARALFLMEGHMNYNVAYGDSANSVFEMDGIDTVIRQGYVSSKKTGTGTPHWANPQVINAVGVTDPMVILKLIKGMVRKLRNRARARQWVIRPEDMVIWMPAAMWPYIADAAASGGMSGYFDDMFVGNMTFRDWNSERSRITNGFFGYGFLEVDNVPVPVIADPNTGKNITFDEGGMDEKNMVSGDIFVLTRRAGGITLLEQQYLNWNAFKTPAETEGSTFQLMNGMIRGGWKQVNNECFQYYVKAGGRLATYFQPLQGRINNVLIETILENENEAGAFWSQDFYAFDGQRGGQGDTLLSPFN